jgi:hypothetical protein
MHRLRTRLALGGLFTALVLCPLAAAFAKSHEDDQQRLWLPSAPAEGRGEITYEFDSVFNQTTATYVAPLGERDLVHRLFSTPTVHTIIATYQINGRIASRLPDTIRVLLESDELVDADSQSRFTVVTARTLDVGVGGRVVEHSLSVAQRIVLDARPRGMPENTVRGPDHERFQLPAQGPLAHVRRKATAWFSLCEFLSLIDQPEIHGTVAGLDFRLNHEVVAGLNRFAAEMLPDGAQRFVDCVPD